MPYSSLPCHREREREREIVASILAFTVLHVHYASSIYQGWLTHCSQGRINPRPSQFFSLPSPQPLCVISQWLSLAINVGIARLPGMGLTNVKLLPPPLSKLATIATLIRSLQVVLIIQTLQGHVRYAKKLNSHYVETAELVARLALY